MNEKRTFCGNRQAIMTAGHLASYAGLAPATKSSGTSIRGEHAPHRGNRFLKRALFQAAFAAIGCKSDPSSRIYYDRLAADGESGKRFGNETIRVTPDGEVSIKLPAPLAHLANARHGRYVLAATVAVRAPG